MMRRISLLSPFISLFAGCQNTIKKGTGEGAMAPSNPRAESDAGTPPATDSRDDVSGEKGPESDAPAPPVRPSDDSSFECAEGAKRKCGTCDLGTQRCLNHFWQECRFDPSPEAIRGCECAEASAEPAGILFIVDAAGSMNSNEYWVAKEEIASIMLDYQERIDFGLVLFPEAPSYNCGITDNRQYTIGSDPRQMIETLNSRETMGSTPTAAAVVKGSQLIRSYQNLRPHSHVAAVIISCGGDSCMGNTTDAFRSIVETGAEIHLIEMANNTFQEVANFLQASGRFDYYNTWADYHSTLGPMIENILETLPPIVPYLEETCNGIDDDCDGQIDEHFDSVRERCDSIDNDCDGETDEGFGVDEFCKPMDYHGGCLAEAHKICGEDGESTVCVVPEIEDEICDGIDNDCDGRTDNLGEDIPCTPPDPDTGTQPPNFIRFIRPAKNIENPVVDAVAVMPDDGHWNFNGDNNLTASWLMTDQGRQYSCTVNLQNHRGEEVAEQNSVLSNGTPQPEGRELTVTFPINISHFNPLHRYTLEIPECRNEVGDTAIVGAATTFYTGDNNLAFGYLFFPGDRAVDVSGHGLDLELRGNPPPTLLPSGEVQFDGVQNYLESGGETLLGLDALWNIFWIQKNNQNRLQAMYTLGSVEGENGYRSYSEFLSDESGFLRMNYYGDDGQITQPVSLIPPLIPGAWQSISVTSDDRFAPGPATLRYYVNGLEVEKNYGPQGGGAITHQHDRPRRILLGAARGDAEPFRYMDGSLRAFLVYNTLKDPNEVYQIMSDLTVE